MAVELKMGKATRDAFGAALREAGRTNPDIVVVTATSIIQHVPSGSRRSFLSASSTSASPNRTW